MNEYIFLIHTSIIGMSTLGALYLGKETLSIIIVLQTILANLFVTKQISFFSFHITPTDAFTIGAITAMNLMQEYYGAKAAKTVLWTSFAAALFFNIMAQIHLWYIPSIYDTSNGHFDAILHNSARIVAASLSSYLLSQYVEYRIYRILKVKFGTQHLIVRASTATLIAQLLDTVIFSFLGLYGVVQSIKHIIMISYAIKVITLLATFPTLWLSRYIVSKKQIHEYL